MIKGNQRGIQQFLKVPLNEENPKIPQDFKAAIDAVLQYNPGPKIVFQIRKEDPKIIDLIKMVRKYSD